MSFIRAAHPSDAPSHIFRSSASEVRVTFFATDENDDSIAAIDKDDFAIVDGDAIVRDFRSLAHSEETEMDAVLLVDASASVATRFRAITSDIAQLLSEKRVDVSDLSVISFSGLNPTVLCAHNCSDPKIARQLLSLTPSGPTPLYDSVIFAADLISRKRMSGIRPVLVLLSDGDDSISKTSLKDALTVLTASGALVYTVDLNRHAYESPVLWQMSELTGGRYLRAGTGARGAMQAAVEDLQNSYVVTYEPPNLKVGYHTIRLLPRHNLNLRFHCRSGYYYGSEGP